MSQDPMEQRDWWDLDLEDWEALYVGLTVVYPLVTEAEIMEPWTDGICGDWC